MDFKNVLSDAKKLSAIAEGWYKRGRAEEIERAIVLDKLKLLYERVMFMETESEAEAAGFESETEPEVEVEFVFSEEAEPTPETEPQPKTEPRSETEPEFLNETEAASGPAERCEVEEAEVSFRPETGVSRQDDPEPAGEAESESGIAPEETDGGVAAAASEKSAEDEPRKEGMHSRQELPRFNEQSLFDLDQIPVRRTSRDVLLSLYSDDDDEVTQFVKLEDQSAAAKRAVESEYFGPEGEEPQEPAIGTEEIGPEAVMPEKYEEEPEEVVPESDEERPDPEQEVAVPESDGEESVVYDSDMEESETGLVGGTGVMPEEPGSAVESVPEPERELEPEHAGAEANVTESPEPSEEAAVSVPAADEDEEPFIDLEVAHGAMEDFSAEETSDDERGYYPDDDDEDFNIIEISDDEEEHPAVLGDVMQENSAPALGDTFHAARTVENGPVRSLKGSIGLNDKFMIIRTLFGGDAELYERTIDDLEEFTDLDEALLYLHDNFRWKPDNEGVNMLVGLLMRKLS